jgi:hypothetical protein
MADVRVQIQSVINTAGSGKCMDDASGGTSNGNPIVQFDCHRGLNQQWALHEATLGGAFQIVSLLDPNMCAGLNSRYANDNDLVVLVPCDPSMNENYAGTLWYLNSSDLNSWWTSHVAFRSALGTTNPNGSCIDVASGLDWDSLWLQVYGCHGGPNQEWTVTNW